MDNSGTSRKDGRLSDADARRMAAVRHQFTLSFRCRLLGGSLAKDSESQELRWVRQDELDSLTIHPSMRKRIDHFFENRAAPYLG